MIIINQINFHMSALIALYYYVSCIMPYPIKLSLVLVKIQENQNQYLVNHIEIQCFEIYVVYYCTCYS